MKRCLGLLAVCLVVSACGSSARVVSPPLHGTPVRLVPPSPAALRFSDVSNREFARRDTQKLIRIVVVPGSARRVPKVPKSAPAWFRQELSHGISGAAVAHRTWVVDEPLRQVVRYVRAHARPRPRPEEGFRKPSNRIGSRPGDDYEFPVPGRSINRWLNVAMLALPSGATVVTAQAGDDWIHPPPRSAELPGTVRRVEITSRYGTKPPRVVLHVRYRYDVGALVSWMNGLGVSPNVVCFGGIFGEPTVVLTFRDASGALVARGGIGQGVGGSCGGLALTVNGRTAPTLMVGDLIQRIEHLLNADLSPPVRRDVSDCLRGRGWQVRKVAGGLAVRKNGPPSTITFHLTGKTTITGRRDPAISLCLRGSPHYIYYK